MTQTPTQRDLMEVGQISQPYASLILKGEKKPSRSLAIHFFKMLGWKHDSISELTSEQINLLAEIEPYSPRRAVA